MSELRYNPLLKDWVMVVASRQDRPQMPSGWCPFCPGSGKVPDAGYTVLRYPNDYPVLSQNPAAPDDVATAFFQVKSAYGRCEVILYSPDHSKTVSGLSDENMFALAKCWQEVYTDFAQDEKIKYIMIFENRGDVVGVTMPHPHGQAYGFSVLPKRLELELASASGHLREKGECLFCRLLAEEGAAQKPRTV